MTKHRNRKDRIRELAADRGITIQQASAVYDELRAQRAAGGAGNDAGGTGAAAEHRPLTLRPRDVHSVEMLNENLAEMRTEYEAETPDPYRRQALLNSRALLWTQLGESARYLADQAADEDLAALLGKFAMACSFASILDKQDVARTRYEHRIPSLHPLVELASLELRTCQACGRPWQRDPDGACPVCPAMLWGISPYSAEDAREIAAGTPPGDRNGRPVPRAELMADPPLRDPDDDGYGDW